MKNTKSRLGTLVCGLALALPLLGKDMQLVQSDYPLLVGTWEGRFESRNSSGRVVFALDVRLNVVEDELGKFWISKDDREWGTIVQIKDGQVVMRFGHAERPFTYSEKGETKRLSVKYNVEFQGSPRKDSLVLTKKE